MTVRKKDKTKTKKKIGITYDVATKGNINYKKLSNPNMYLPSFQSFSYVTVTENETAINHLSDASLGSSRGAISVDVPCLNNDERCRLKRSGPRLRTKPHCPTKTTIHNICLIRRLARVRCTPSRATTTTAAEKKCDGKRKEY